MSINISAKPSPEIPPSASGEMRALPPALGIMRHEPEQPKKPGKIGLFSCGGGAVVPIDTRAKSLKTTKILSRCQTAWREAQGLILKKDAFASSILIKAVPNPDSPHRDVVVISYRDKAGDLRYVSQKEIPQGLLDRVEKIRNLVRPNRNISPPVPLQLPVPELLPNSCGEFLKTHYKSLEVGLKDPAKSEALRNIVTSEAMIQGFGMHLFALVRKKEEELNKTPLLPHLPHKKKDEELTKLRHLYRQLQSIDRYAVYRAVASWANLQTGSIDGALRSEINQAADTISLEVGRDLQPLEKARQGKHYIKNSRIGRYLGFFKPMEDKDIHSYALDVGSLIIQDRWDYPERREGADRKDTKSCVEQLIVQMMMNVLNPAISVDESHPLLDPFDPDTRKELIALIEAPVAQPDPKTDPQYYPKAYARIVHEQVGKTLAPLAKEGLEAKLNALKALQDPQYRLDKLVNS